MTALGEDLGPVRGMRRFADAGVPFSTTAPFNHASEVQESAGLRPANYGEKTLPTIGKVQGKQETPTDTGG